MLVDFGKAGLVAKARQQPERVYQALVKVRTDGLLPTIEAVRNKLDRQIPLGYCNVGVALEIGAGVSDFAAGGRVVSNGPHSQLVSVPKNLCARIPDSVSNETAAFTVIGAVGLEAIRLAEPSLGEAVVVTGLGLVGLITVQLLQANGCRVLGLDYDRDRLDLAHRFGAEIADLSAGADPVAAAMEFSRGRGVDAVLITASAKSSEPVHQAATMCRKRGRIVLVGVTGLELSRADFYEKELSFQVSCSYGPGRHDPNYEEKGEDYPFGFVRWTEQRNFEAMLDMMAEGRIDVTPLISHRFAIDEAEKAYSLISGSERSLGVLFTYPTVDELDEAELRQPRVTFPDRPRVASKAVVSVIGAGSYAGGVLIPALKSAGARLRSVVSLSGVSGVHVGRKFGFEEAVTDTAAVLTDTEVTAVVIATRHDTHASLVVEAIAAGKHVFVEKPLALTHEGLDNIVAARKRTRGAPRILMVGFNRRFSPQIERIKILLSSLENAKSFVLTVNAGAVPANHWTLDPEIGGGRIVGEVCHFVDLLRFLASSTITGHHIHRMESHSRDSATVQLEFATGSIGTIHYFANGNKGFPKERLEVFGGGRVLQLDNFRRLHAYGWPGFRRMNLFRQDKGQKACIERFVSAVENGETDPIPFDEIIEVSRVTIDLATA